MNSIEYALIAFKFLVMWAFGVLLLGCGEDHPTKQAKIMQSETSRSEIFYEPTQGSDTFYYTEENLSGLAPGTLLLNREVTYAPLGIPMPNKAWQFQYVTEDANGTKLMAVATVLSPLGQNQNNKLVSYQFAYDSLGFTCTPSQSLVGSRENVNSNLEHALYQVGLNNLGWTMVFADYEGPYHDFGAGVLSGRATLDAIRAALAFKPLGLGEQTNIALWGYSGGGLATAWASTLHTNYAPELNIKVAAMGGTPTDIISVVRHTENTNNFGLLFSALLGITRQYPAFLPPSALNAEGFKLANSIKDGCIGGTTDQTPNANNRQLSDYTINENPFESAGINKVKSQLNLPQPTAAPTFPVFLYHETLDNLVPVENTDRLFDGWCSSGTSVTYSRPTGGNHISVAASEAPSASEFIDAYLSGGTSEIPRNAKSCN